jgi:hypothetical protein
VAFILILIVILLDWSGLLSGGFGHLNMRR